MDVKYDAESTIRYALPPSVNEITDENFRLKSLFPKGVKVNITIDDIRLKPNLTTKRTITVFEKCFFYTVLGFIQSCSGVLGHIEGVDQIFPGSFKSDKPVNIRGIDKVH